MLTAATETWEEKVMRNNKFRDWLQRFAYGRYGTDELNKFLAMIIFILLIIDIFAQSTFLMIVILLLLIWETFRTLSRNTSARAEENRKYLDAVGSVRGFFTGGMRRARDKEHMYFKCPNCGQRVRVPSHKGHIEITCPKCRTKFVKDTGAKR